MTDEAEPPVAPLPQPPREAGEDPVPSPGGPQQAAEANETKPERQRITLTVARDLASRSRSLNARYLALITAMAEVGVDGTETGGLRGQLNEAFVELRAGAAHVDEAIRLVTGVTSALEDL